MLPWLIGAGIAAAAVAVAKSISDSEEEERRRRAQNNAEWEEAQEAQRQLEQERYEIERAEKRQQFIYDTARLIEDKTTVIQQILEQITQTQALQAPSAENVASAFDSNVWDDTVTDDGTLGEQFAFWVSEKNPHHITDLADVLAKISAFYQVKIEPHAQLLDYVKDFFIVQEECDEIDHLIQKLEERS